jgi:drug/metabolite transporter (DMT)-like permease
MLELPGEETKSHLARTVLGRHSIRKFLPRPVPREGVEEVVVSAPGAAGVSRRSCAVAGIVIVMIVWGSTFVVTKAAVHEIPPLTLTFLRFLITAAVLVPIAAARGGLKRLPQPLPLAALVLMGLTGVAIFHVGFTYAMVYGSAAQGAIVFALVPAAVVIAAIVGLKEAPSKHRIAGILLSVCGVALVVATGESGSASPAPLLGAAFMLGAVAAWAAYTALAKRLAATDQVVLIACVSVIGMAMVLPAAAVELSLVPWPDPSLQGWLGTLFLGVVASALAFVVYSRALRELDASLVGAYLNLDPIVGVLTAVIFLGEKLGLWQISGGVVALAGMWLASVERGGPDPGRNSPTTDVVGEAARWALPAVPPCRGQGAMDPRVATMRADCQVYPIPGATSAPP